MKIRPVGFELLHTDGQTYMTNLIVAFRNFAKSAEQQPTVGLLHESAACLYTHILLVSFVLVR